MYRKIDPRIWNDRKFVHLDETTQLVFLFLLTHQHVTCLGAMRANSDGLAREKPMKLGRFRRCLMQLSELSMIEMNEKVSFIGFPNWLKYNGPEGPNSVVKGWIAALNLLPDCPEKDRVISRSANYLRQCSEPFRNIAITPAVAEAFGLPSEMACPMPSPMSSGMPCPIQKQKQKQKQERKQKDTDSSERSVRPAGGGPDNPSEPPGSADQARRRRRTTKPATEGAGEVVALIPLANGTEAPVTSDIADEWQKAFPGVNVRAELGRIRVYFLTNPSKRKTAAGIGRCITGWLGRTQDRGGNAGAVTPASSAGVQRDRSGAPLPPPKKTATQPRVIDGVFYMEEYDIATGQALRRWPKDNPKQVQEVKP